MKKIAKLIALLIAVTLIASLAGCGATPEPTAEPTAPPTAVPTQPAAATPEPTVEPTLEPTPEPPPAAEPVTLRYANWNLGTEEENNIQRQLVKAYTDAHPNVTIEFVDMSGEGGWEALLTAYAAKGELPDVFMANNVPLYVQNGWVADLTDLVKDDADWQDVPTPLKDLFTYDGKILGVPAAQFFMGYFVNKDLYEAANLDAPEYGFSVDDWNTAVTSLNDVAKGVLGLDEQEFVEGWYPSTQDPALKWFGFDGKHMNYNSAAFKAGIDKFIEVKPYTWQGLSDEQKTNFKSTGPWELFLNQEVGMRWDASWAVPGIVQNATFEWDFAGIPGGNQALVADVMVVGKTAENLEAAYDFLKWMTFSKEAWNKEAELAKAAGSAPKMPVSIDADSLAAYKEFVNMPGIIAALDNLENSLVESLAKVVPGYINARWEGKPGIDIGEDKDVNMWYMFANAGAGTYKYEDYSAQLEEFANKTLDDAAAAMNK
jgi:multiple sugar transport system substrate-binding protein